MIWKTKSLSLSYNCHVYQLPFRKLKSYSTRENWLQQFAPIADKVFFVFIRKVIRRSIEFCRKVKLSNYDFVNKLLLPLDYLKGLLKCLLLPFLLSTCNDWHFTQKTIDQSIGRYHPQFFFPNNEGWKIEPRLIARKVVKSFI